MTRNDKEHLKVMIGAYLNACKGLAEVKYQKNEITADTKDHVFQLLETIKDNIKNKIVEDFENNIDTSITFEED